jgi:hypothetical protein
MGRVRMTYQRLRNVVCTVRHVSKVQFILECTFQFVCCPLCNMQCSYFCCLVDGRSITPHWMYISGRLHPTAVYPRGSAPCIQLVTSRLAEMAVHLMRVLSFIWGGGGQATWYVGPPQMMGASGVNMPQCPI